MKKIIFNFWNLLENKEKIGLIISAILAILSSLLEMLTIYIIYSWLNGVLVDEKNFISSLPVYTIIIFIFLSGFVRIISLMYNNQFALSKEHSFSISAVKNIVNSDYNLITQLGEGSLIKRSMQDGSILAYEIMLPLISLINGIILVFCLISGMFFINPILTFQLSLGLFFLYFIYNYFISEIIKSLSDLRNQANHKKFHLASEIFKAIMELKLFNIIDPFISRLSIQTTNHSYARIKLINFSLTPRIVLETLLFISLFAVVAFSTVDQIVELVPLLTAFLAITIKLIPAMQNVFSAKNQIKFAEQSLNDYLSLKKLCEKQHINNKVNKFLEFDFQDLVIDNLIIGYDKLKLIEIPKFQIKRGDRIIIHGESGSGKSTFLKVLAGLTTSHYDSLVLNGSISTFNEFSNKVAFLSQKPSLFTGTILQNITLQFDNKISKEKRNIAISIAESLNLFSSGNLNIDNEIKPSSSNISGGQAQRIALSRALFFKKEVLMLDEPTSALDDKDENAVTETLNCLPKSLAVIIISHKKLNRIDNAVRFNINDNKLIKL